MLTDGFMKCTFVSGSLLLWSRDIFIGSDWRQELWHRRSGGTSTINCDRGEEAATEEASSDVPPKVDGGRRYRACSNPEEIETPEEEEDDETDRTHTATDGQWTMDGAAPSHARGDGWMEDWPHRKLWSGFLQVKRRSLSLPGLSYPATLKDLKEVLFIYLAVNSFPHCVHWNNNICCECSFITLCDANFLLQMEQLTPSQDFWCWFLTYGK